MMMLYISFSSHDQIKIHHSWKQFHHKVQYFPAAVGDSRMTHLKYNEPAVQQLHVPVDPKQMVGIRPPQQYIFLFQFLSPETTNIKQGLICSLSLAHKRTGKRKQMRWNENEGHQSHITIRHEKPASMSMTLCFQHALKGDQTLIYK